VMSVTEDPLLVKAYGNEQAWSGSLPRWTWILQFLVLAPINIILVGQIALFITSALHQTPADGNSVLNIYLTMAALTVLLMLPLSPFLHRFTYHLPTFFFFIFVGCLIYNLLAFPFSREARLKHYFVQNIDLDTGNNTVQLTGVEGYVETIVDEIPSVAGQAWNCGKTDDPRRAGLQTCRWEGLAPNVVPETENSSTSGNHSKNPYLDWVQYNISTSGEHASISFRGLETKNCRLLFDTPVNSYHIANTTERVHVKPKPSRGEDRSRAGMSELPSLLANGRRTSVSMLRGRTASPRARLVKWAACGPTPTSRASFLRWMKSGASSRFGVWLARVAMDLWRAGEIGRFEFLECFSLLKLSVLRFLLWSLCLKFVCLFFAWV